MKSAILYGGLLLLALSAPAWQFFDLQAEGLQRTMAPPGLPASSNAAANDYLKPVLAQLLWNRQRGGAQKTAGGAATLAASSSATSWLLQAVGHRQARASVAVIAEGGNVKTYRVGDTLPDGATLTRVLADSIVIEKSGEERRVYLFKEK